MRVVMSYDVSDDPARTRVAKVLEGTLTRVQYSVFEGDLDDDRLAELVDRVLVHIEPETDSLRVYRLCASCTERITRYGRSVEVSTQQVLVV
jgi:CRISPR-associated protein Cas2